MTESVACQSRDERAGAGVTEGPTVVAYSAISLKAKPPIDRRVVLIPLVVVREASCQMRRHETDGCVCVIEPYCNRALITCHARESSLLYAPFDILDVMQYRCFDKYAECRPDELTASQQNISLVVCSAVTPVQRPFDCLLPQLFPSRVAVHDLLGVELYYLLESHRDDLGLDGPEFRWT